MFVLVVRLLTKNLNGFKKWQLLFPLLLFFTAIALNYFTDLRFVLNDKQQYANFDALVMHYSSFAALTRGMKNIAWLFGSIFFFDSGIDAHFLSILYPIKIFVYSVGLLGFGVVFSRAFTSSFSLFNSGEYFNRKDRYDQYFILLFLVMLLEQGFRVCRIN